MNNSSSSDSNYYSAKYRNHGKSQKKFGTGTMCFAMIWMFFLGVWVGSDTFPIHLFKNNSLNKNHFIKVNPKKLTKTTEIDFYKALKQDDISLLKPDDLKKVEKNYIADNKLNNKKKEKTITQSSINKDNADKYSLLKKHQDYNKFFGQNSKSYTLQIAAFKNPGSAVGLVDSLEKKGFPAYTSTINLSSKGIWYRVRIGRFKKLNIAKNIQEELHKDKIDSIVVPFQAEGELEFSIAKEKSNNPES